MQIGEMRRVRGAVVPPIMYGTAWKEERTGALTSEAIRIASGCMQTFAAEVS
jgi:hypothetical protein